MVGAMRPAEPSQRRRPAAREKPPTAVVVGLGRLGLWLEAGQGMDAELCEKCGNRYLPDARFCRKCGNRRGDAAMRPPPHMVRPMVAPGMVPLAPVTAQMAPVTASSVTATAPPVTVAAPPVTVTAPPVTVTAPPVTAPPVTAAMQMVSSPPPVQMVSKVVEVPQVEVQETRDLY